MRGVGRLKRFCSERPGGAAATSESREPVKLCLATSSKGGKVEVAGRRKRDMDGRVLSPSSFAEELISGLSREDEGAGAPHCAPGRATFPSVAVYASRFPYAMHTPSECGGFAPTGFELWRLTPTRAHSVILFRTTGW